MRRRSYPSKGEHYQWESFPPHSESDRQLARETLLRLHELYPGMRQPSTRSGRDEIIRILTEAIEEYQFPPFVRYGYEDGPDAALNALYQAYIKLRSNLASRLMKLSLAIPNNSRAPNNRHHQHHPGIPLAHNEPIPPEHVSFELWTQFLKMDCDYKEGIEEIRPLDANGQALAPVRTPNRLRFLLLQATGHILVFEIVASCPMTERRPSRNQRRLVAESV
ncbi:predicted protein [Aspergillus terreus NIH2624]|uniref:Uncharacterized protein n=1 Tax=Aspergillus terreus (strain NIH 2624 / FGSC A1156) TaxID=341663 RepID=Q0CUY7_ASPTN|nr:uncharacterized protein ATEG_02497 [Aspergillus terreus NIH2624]EAU37459.1 predicted protein [Aspergillus terreus NIH2624]